MRTTAAAIRLMKDQQSIVLLSAYDAIWAQLGESAGADVLLVGDSVGIRVLGYGSVVPVTLEMLLHHLKAVVRGSARALVVADMPLGDYGVDTAETVRHAVRLVKEGGAGAIKMAGGAELAGTVEALTKIGIPVMGHLGVNSSHAALGQAGPVVGVKPEERQAILDDAKALEQSGVFALIAKCMAPEVTRELAARTSVPIISIGSGKADGVGANIIDLVGLSKGVTWFSLRQIEGGELFGTGIADFVNGVKAGTVVAKSWKEDATH